jgi:hypothetical protein
LAIGWVDGNIRADKRFPRVKERLRKAHGEIAQLLWQSDVCESNVEGKTKRSNHYEEF